MKDYLLIPDMTATVRVDPERLRIELFSSDADRDTLLAEYDSDRDSPRAEIEIGYIPASELTRISAMTAEEDDSHERRVLRMAEQQRELVRRGVVGWNLRGDLGRKDGRISDAAIDIIERRHWLVPLAVQISRYNSLSEEKKSLS